jgi:hypothetical protein
MGVLAAIITTIVGILHTNPIVFNAGLFSGIPLSLLGIVPAIDKSHKAKTLPTEDALGKFVAAPDYNEKLGFIHEVSEEVEHVLEIIPKDFGALVIFIDDLDRCSPNSIAKVMEGVNLFLAGEFKNCIFISWNGCRNGRLIGSPQRANFQASCLFNQYANRMAIYGQIHTASKIIIPPVIQEDSLKYAEALVSYPETIVGTPVRHFVAPGQPNVGISWQKLMERLGWWTGPGQKKRRRRIYNILHAIRML